jgi:arginine/lysine/ornithine decarboxylase
MDTPVVDFVNRYQSSDPVRLHMPGHKGKPFLGCEAMDITEISGADSLYEADGIIAKSEANAASLFGSGKTLYSTEGSSQCIRAMLYLALTCRSGDSSPVILAARNVHKAFIYAAALLDFEIVWLLPDEGTSRSICGCPISPERLEAALAALDAPPAAVYLTSPDYLGGLADISALAEICHRHRTVLAVDNAHGAYLHFLRPAIHPLDLGADLCCDSAHKTLPVLTGGAYLQISQSAPEAFRQNARAAMALFGSTSPSYLTLCSLDRCNRYLDDHYAERLADTIDQLAELRLSLAANGWQTELTDPLRITLCAPAGLTGTLLAKRLRQQGIECEYADSEFLVLMATPENAPADFARLLAALGQNHAPFSARPALPVPAGERVLSVRQALFAPHETIPACQALGRICGAPTVSCPPAIPIAVSGERIGQAALDLFSHYGIETIDVLTNP